MEKVILGNNKKMIRLPDSELDIMMVIWSCERSKSMNKAQITEVLKEKNN